MFNFNWHIVFSTVNTFPSKFLKQVFLNFVTGVSRTQMTMPCSSPCWYSTPDISGFCSLRSAVTSWTAIFCISNFAVSQLIATIGQKKHNRFTHVSILATRLVSDGGNHPSGRVRFENLGCRYRVFRFLRLRRDARRESSTFFILWPRCWTSVANTTSPVPSLTIAIPVVLLPGSIFSRNGCISAFCVATFRIMVNG